MHPEPLFSTSGPWCDHPIILTPERWKHIVDRHPEMAPLIAQVKLAVERPNIVVETTHSLPTRAYYAKGLLADFPRYRECYVAALVRYTMEPACIWTAYLVSRLGNSGTVLDAKA